MTPRARPAPPGCSQAYVPLPRRAIEPHANALAGAEFVVDRFTGPAGTRCMPRVANRGPPLNRLREQIAAGPEEVRARRQILRQPRLYRISGERIRDAGPGVRESNPRERATRQQIDRRPLIVAQSIRAAVNPDAARGQALPGLRARGPHDGVR